MAKRFTDTDKWKKPFIRALEGPYKLLWFYILDDCDIAGIWQVDFEVAQIRMGEIVSESEALKLFQDRIIVFDEGKKWFLKDFAVFQYGELKASNRMHVAVMSIIKKNNLDEIYNGPSKGLTSPQGQGQGQGNGQGEGQGEGQDGEAETKTPKEIHDLVFAEPIFLRNLNDSHPGKDYERAWAECYAYHSNRPNPPNQLWVWRQKVLTWLSNMKPEAAHTKPTKKKSYQEFIKKAS
jgi:hypothetical protein